MMVVCKKTYTLEVVIQEGQMNEQPWADWRRQGKTGCDEITELCRYALTQAGLKAQVRFVKFSEEIPR